MMSPEDRKKLDELAAELAGVSQSIWQPRCISAAFSTAANTAPFAFRMQTWIDLDAVRSPVLELRLPEENIIPALKEALAAFGQVEATVDELNAEEVVGLFNEMIAAVRAGFSMRLEMEPPKAGGSDRGSGGFGNWLPFYACLVGQMRIPPSEVRAMLVGEVFGLIAAHRWNQFWRVAGTAYQYREIED